MDGKDDLNNESLSEILGGIEVKLDPELGALLGDDAEVAALNLGWAQANQLDIGHKALCPISLSGKGVGR